MRLLDRLRGERAPAEEQLAGTLQADARAIRTTLSALHFERIAAGAAPSEPDLHGLVRDVLEGEVTAPTDDVRFLISDDTDPAEFLDAEITPNWDGLDENAR